MFDLGEEAGEIDHQVDRLDVNIYDEGDLGESGSSALMFPHRRSRPSPTFEEDSGDDWFDMVDEFDDDRHAPPTEADDGADLFDIVDDLDDEFGLEPVGGDFFDDGEESEGERTEGGNDERLACGTGHSATRSSCARSATATVSGNRRLFTR